MTPAANTPLGPPDLSTDEGRAAYRMELRRVGFWPYSLGMGLIIAGALTLLWMKFGSHAGPNPRLWTAAMGVLSVGWVLFVVALLMRNRYHRRRLAGGA
jgi:hypothetical protein